MKWRVASSLLMAGVVGMLAPAVDASITFADRSQAAGFEPGHLANTPSGGIAVADFDGNGFPDLFITGYFLPNRLYFNQGDGTFSQSESINADLAGSECSSAAAADFNNDGWPDLYVGCRNQSNLLLRNMAGTGFVNDISPVVDHAPSSVNSARTDAVAWADVDGNGWLDLYIGVYPTSSNPDLDDPDNLDRIVLNFGEGKWVKATSNWTLDARAALSRTALAQAFSDLDLDGRLDLYVVNDKLQGNVLWRSQGPGCGGACLLDATTGTGLGRPVFGMGLAIGDVDRDGLWDLYFSSIDEQVLLRGTQLNPLTFEEDPDSALNYEGVGWGTILADFDNDGWEDAFLSVNPGSFSTTSSVDQVFRNQGDGSFTSVAKGSGLAIVRPSEAAARFDMDKDGRLDLVIGHWNDEPGYRLYRNVTAPTGNWIGFRLIGSGSINRDAIGTRIVLDDGGPKAQMRELRSGESRGSSHESSLHFGLGNIEQVSIEVRWPDGLIQQIDGLDVNQYHTLTHTGGSGLFGDRFEPP